MICSVYWEQAAQIQKSAITQAFCASVATIFNSLPAVLSQTNNQRGAFCSSLSLKVEWECRKKATISLIIQILAIKMPWNLKPTQEWKSIRARSKKLSKYLYQLAKKLPKSKSHANAKAWSLYKSTRLYSKAILGTPNLRNVSSQLATPPKTIPLTPPDLHHRLLSTNKHHNANRYTAHLQA